MAVLTSRDDDVMQKIDELKASDPTLRWDEIAERFRQPDPSKLKGTFKRWKNLKIFGRTHGASISDVKDVRNVRFRPDPSYIPAAIRKSRSKPQQYTGLDDGTRDDIPPDHGDKVHFEEDAQSSLQVHKNYVYNPVDDVYVTFVPNKPHPVVMGGDRHRAMLEAYSNWNGDPSSINEICRTFEITRADFTGYKKAHGWTHDLEPFTAEELMAKDTEDLVETALLSKRQGLFKRFSQESWRRTERDAERWQRFELYVLEPLVRSMESAIPNHVPPAVNRIAEPKRRALVLSTADAHLGKYAYKPETGTEYNLDIATDLLLKCTAAILHEARHAEPELIYFVVGSDYVHIDNTNGTTENGTPQDVDGSMMRIIQVAQTTAVQMVEMMRQVAPVKISMASGNHDRLMSWVVLLYLQAWFRNYDDVQFIISPHYRQYELYGDCLLGFTHGDGPKKQRLGPLMLKEANELIRSSKHHMWFTGHKHFEEVSDIDGVLVYQLPSISGSDRWHTRGGYTASRRAMAGYVVDSRWGVVNTINVPIEAVADYE